MDEEIKKSDLENQILELNKLVVFKYRGTKLSPKQQLSYNAFGWYADSIGEALWETNQKLVVILDELASQNKKLSENLEKAERKLAKSETAIKDLSGTVNILVENIRNLNNERETILNRLSDLEICVSDDSLVTRVTDIEKREEWVRERFDENNKRLDIHDQRLDENNNRLDNHDKRLDENNERFDKHDERFDENNKRLDIHDQRLDENNNRLDNHDKRLDENNERFDKHDQRFDENNKRLDNHDKRLDENNERFDKHDQRFDENNKRLDNHDKRLDENNNRLDNHDKRLDENNERFDKHDQRFDENNKRLDNHDKRLDENNERFDKHDQRFDENNKRLDNHDKRLDENNQRFDEHDRRLDENNERFDLHDIRLDNNNDRFYDHIQWISKLENSDFDYKFGNKVDANFQHSRLCTAKELMSEDLQKYKNPLKFDEYGKQIQYPNSIRYTRKEWEFEAIALTLDEFGLLTEGKRGVGFAVGVEPLAAYFASRGCQVLATDLAVCEDKNGLWTNTAQNAMGTTESLNMFGICDEKVFVERVEYRDVDMNHIPEDIRGFDFCWSSCAIEHIGGLEKSKKFLKNVLSVLKPGGISVHTTEINLDSNISTIKDGFSIIFRRCDLEEICSWMNENGHKMFIDFKRGNDTMDMKMCDYRCNVSSYSDYMLNCNIEGYDSTSFIIIIQKGK